MMRTAARFHRHGAAPKNVDEPRHRTAPHPTPQNNPARGIQSRQAARVLAQIDPQNHDIHRSAPLSPTSHDPTIAARGAGHPIITNLPKTRGSWSSPAADRRLRDASGR